jgi:gas vesicle protein
MSALLDRPIEQTSSSTNLQDTTQSLHINLVVTDSDSVFELSSRREGRDRDEYALAALKIGVLSLRHATGQIDVEAVRREGDRLLTELDQALENSRIMLNGNLSSVLKEYFDPSSGRFQERLERLIRRDGELEQLLRRQIGSDGSELAKTLAEHIGENSAIMRLLDPNESDSLAQTIRHSAEEALESERERILTEFSLDNKESALSRMVTELTENNGRLTGDLTSKIDEAIKEFSLDKDDSALSRLVRKVESAQRTITDEFSLDNEGSALNRMSNLLGKATDAINNNLSLDKEGSALGRLRREVIEILDRHEAQATTFQRDVTCALEAIKARREESLRSTAHGKEFQDVVFEFAQREALRSGDLATCTGGTTGAIKHCKIGDAVIELGPDCAAAGERFVIEAKEDATYDLNKARVEIESARKNRQARVGLFVFSNKTAPVGQEAFLRYGNDIFVIWNEEDLSNDVILKAALSLAKALCVRETKAREAEAADFEAIDAAILVIEKEAKRLQKMNTWTETIKSNSGKILEEVRKMTEELNQQIQILRDATIGLKDSLAGTA